MKDIIPSLLVKHLKIRFIIVGFLSIIISFFAKMDLWLIIIFQLSIWVLIFSSIGSLSSINHIINAKFPFKDRKELK